MMFAKALPRGFLAAAVLASAVAASAQGVFNMPGNETSLQFVTVGNPGNAADTTGYGAVPHTYKIGTYDVTLGQYTAFLNAVAKTDTYGLYNSYMGSAFSTLGIQQSGSSGNYTYSVTGSYSQGVNCPAFYVSWGDAARFCNWLQNGQLTVAQGGLAITETGAYTLSGATSDAALMAVARNAGAKYFIPSENEWYKAAYYKGGGNNSGYWYYPTQSTSNNPPSNVLSTTGTNNANYWNGGYTDPTNYLTPVGYFAGSPGPYGTYDMGGDVWQWNEANLSNSYRGLRGGSFNGASNSLASSYRAGGYPTYEDDSFGFRVAGTPEPGSITLLVAGAIAGLMCWRRWR
jgi:formylglycine-generating enzyme required for sulfatase activity